MIIYGRNVIITSLEAKQKIHEIWIAQNANGPIIKKIQQMARQNEIPVKSQPNNVMDKKAGFGNVHQGVVAFIDDFSYSDMYAFFNTISDKEKQLVIVLDQINDPHNLGAIIRTADCAGVDAVIIPSHNSAQITNTVIKVSAGASFYIPIIKVNSLEDTIQELQSRSYKIVTTDGDSEQTLYEPNYNEKIALIIGNEGTGIRKKIKGMSDYRIKIPLYGKTESLNASVAAGICIYHIKENQK